MKFPVAFLLLAAVAFALTPLPDSVNGQRVYDYGNILGNAQLLNGELLAYERNTTVQIALVTLDSVPPDYTLFDYGVALFRKWGIGQSDDNGILILIVKNGTTGNRMRIELGYGIQGYITGAEAGRVLDDAMPYYQQGDYQTTAEIIIAGLEAQLTGYVPGQRPMPDVMTVIPAFFPVIIFMIIGTVSVAMRNRCPYCLKGKLVKKGDYYVCNRCGKKITKKKRYAPVFVGGGFHGGGFGGGFGGGASGGGGAGR